MRETVYLNGQFLPVEEARISPNDRGFIFADGVYEVVKYYNGMPFRFNDHLQRLERSLGELELEYADLSKLKEIFQKLVMENSLQEKHAGVYVQITRGVNKRVHHFPQEIQPTVYAFAFDLPSSTENLEKGIKVITEADIRWQRCDIKSVSLLPNTMLFNKAVKNGAGECILLRDGVVTEATHSSVLMIKDGVVITHPLSDLILPGITRKVVLEICAENNIPFEEKAISEKDLFEMDEIIIAGTGSEITPVIQVDDVAVGNKIPGKITRFIQQKFFEKVESRLITLNFRE